MLSGKAKESEKSEEEEVGASSDSYGAGAGGDVNSALESYREVVVAPSLGPPKLSE